MKNTTKLDYSSLFWAKKSQQPNYLPPPAAHAPPTWPKMCYQPPPRAAQTPSPLTLPTPPRNPATPRASDGALPAAAAWSCLAAGRPRRSGTCARRSAGRGAKAQRPTAAAARVGARGRLRAPCCAQVGRPALGDRALRLRVYARPAQRTATCRSGQRPRAQGAGGKQAWGQPGRGAPCSAQRRTASPSRRHHTRQSTEASQV